MAGSNPNSSTDEGVNKLWYITQHTLAYYSIATTKQLFVYSVTRMNLINRLLSRRSHMQEYLLWEQVKLMIIEVRSMVTSSRGVWYELGRGTRKLIGFCWKSPFSSRWWSHGRGLMEKSIKHLGLVQTMNVIICVNPSRGKKGGVRQAPFLRVYRMSSLACNYLLTAQRGGCA